MKIHGFHGNPLCEFKEWGYTYKNTYISIATHQVDYKTRCQTNP